MVFVVVGVTVGLEGVAPEHEEKDREGQELAETLVQLGDHVPSIRVVVLEGVQVGQRLEEDDQLGQFVHAGAPEEQDDHREVQPSDLVI